MKKQGHYRKLTKVEILKDSEVYKKGDIREMHPVLANRLIALDLAKKSTKVVNVGSVIGVGVIKTDK